MKVVRMSKQAILRDRAEELVRKVLTETFGQKTDSKIISNAAAKVVRAVPSAHRKGYAAKEEISSSDQT
jgi:hypothetical protein